MWGRIGIKPQNWLPWTTAGARGWESHIISSSSSSSSTSPVLLVLPLLLAVVGKKATPTDSSSRRRVTAGSAHIKGLLSVNSRGRRCIIPQTHRYVADSIILDEPYSEIDPLWLYGQFARLSRETAKITAPWRLDLISLLNWKRAEELVGW